MKIMRLMLRKAMAANGRMANPLFSFGIIAGITFSFFFIISSSSFFTTNHSHSLLVCFTRHWYLFSVSLFLFLSYFFKKDIQYADKAPVTGRERYERDALVKLRHCVNHWKEYLFYSSFFINNLIQFIFSKITTPITSK